MRPASTRLSRRGHCSDGQGRENGHGWLDTRQQQHAFRAFHSLLLNCQGHGRDHMFDNYIDGVLTCCRSYK